MRSSGSTKCQAIDVSGRRLPLGIGFYLHGAVLERPRDEPVRRVLDTVNISVLEDAEIVSVNIGQVRKPQVGADDRRAGEIGIAEVSSP